MILSAAEFVACTTTWGVIEGLDGRRIRVALVEVGDRVARGGHESANTVDQSFAMLATTQPRRAAMSRIDSSDSNVPALLS